MGDPPTIGTGSNLSLPSDMASVYGDGALMPVTLDELTGNQTAIKQLINNHNDQAKKRVEAERRLARTESELEYLRTSPFISIVALLVGSVGTVVGGIGVNMATGDKPAAYATLLVWIGAGTVVLSGVINILYPYARRVFNRPKPAPKPAP